MCDPPVLRGGGTARAVGAELCTGELFTADGHQGICGEALQQHRRRHAPIQLRPQPFFLGVSVSGVGFSYQVVGRRDARDLAAALGKYDGRHRKLIQAISMRLRSLRSRKPATLEIPRLRSLFPDRKSTVF